MIFQLALIPALLAMAIIEAVIKGAAGAARAAPIAARRRAIIAQLEQMKRDDIEKHKKWDNEIDRIANFELDNARLSLAASLPALTPSLEVPADVRAWARSNSIPSISVLDWVETNFGGLAVFGRYRDWATKRHAGLSSRDKEIFEASHDDRSSIDIVQERLSWMAQHLDGRMATTKKFARPGEIDYDLVNAIIMISASQARADIRSAA